MNEPTRRLLLDYADDELVMGWRDSEWTGIAPLLEEDVAFSSIAQNEIGHARAIYELLVGEDGDADAMAFDRRPEEYRCAPLVELPLLDWAHTIARRVLYEKVEQIVLSDLRTFPLYSDDPAVVGLATKIDREEAYHRMHADMWAARLGGEPRFRAAILELLPYALGMLEDMNRPALLQELGALIPMGDDAFDPYEPEPVERGVHDASWTPFWEEMTEVRRSAPAGAQW